MRMLERRTATALLLGVSLLLCLALPEGTLAGGKVEPGARGTSVPAGSARDGESVQLRAARQVLSLTEARLGLMKQVMASKWLSRSPVQDLAQERAVKDAAVAAALQLGVGANGTRRLFEAEMAAAKEVEFGWGTRWLYYGAPAHLPAPELEDLRGQLSGISERIVAVLPQVAGLGGVPGAPARVTGIAADLLHVPFLCPQGRAAVVDALLTIRRHPIQGAGQQP